MKHYLSIISLVLILASCGVGGNRFRLEGRLRNLNQGEFYVYSPDGGMTGTDTIQVRDGRFAYERPLHGNYTFIVIFPNFSELPVFASPGTSLSVKGDATHLKELSVKGEKVNEQMSKLRQQLARLTPPEELKEVADFIRHNPQSTISNYLLNRYFVLTTTPDYQQASELVALMVKQQPDNARLLALKRDIDILKKSCKGTMLPSFTATDIKGNAVSKAQLNGDLNILNTWATWSYQSGDIQRRLQRMKKKYGAKLSVVTLCLDGNVKDIKRRIERDSISWPVVCDGRMFQSPMVHQTGLMTVPAMMMADKAGRIIARDIEPENLEREVEQRIK